MNLSNSLYPSLAKQADKLYSLLRDRVITARMVADPQESIPHFSGVEQKVGVPTPARGAMTTHEAHHLEAAPHLASMLTSQLSRCTKGRMERILRRVGPGIQGQLRHCG